MSSLRIVGINWLSQQAKEAEVRVEDELGTSFLAFAHPCRNRTGDRVREFQAFDVTEVESVAGCDTSRVEHLDGLEHRVVGPVSSSGSAVAIGDSEIELDAALPGDVKPGDWIQFKCARIDLFE